MSETYQHTALLIFSRTIKEEAEKKQFAGPRGEQTTHLSIAKALFHKTLLLGERSGISTFVSLSSTQKGANFGEKIANEAQKIFNKGFKKLIIIGTDCPELSLPEIYEAANLLQNSNSTVIGPAHDRGAYLIGIHYKHFKRSEFEKLPWQTDSLLNEWIQSYDHTVFLDYLQDIDSAIDLKSFLSSENENGRFQRLLISLLLNTSIKFLLNNPFLRSQNHHYYRFFRGPPSIA